MTSFLFTKRNPRDAIRNNKSDEPWTRFGDGRHVRWLKNQLGVIECRLRLLKFCSVDLTVSQFPYQLQQSDSAWDFLNSEVFSFQKFFIQKAIEMRTQRHRRYLTSASSGYACPSGSAWNRWWRWKWWSWWVWGWWFGDSFGRWLWILSVFDANRLGKQLKWKILRFRDPLRASKMFYQ